MRSPSAFDQSFDGDSIPVDSGEPMPVPIYRDANGRVVEKGDDPPSPVPVRRAPTSSGASDPTPGEFSKIRQLDQALSGASRHEEAWNRTPNVTGMGAIHVKSFHCKLTGDCLNLLDQQINEWLDAHPQYEVKQVTTSVGEWSGKTREPNLIVNVWV
ncbi:MAG: hypothetical protein EA378_11055 [Phycisphaerales bacterium]|nr:MAG: hypothetical protein EA378_11055 [Phycisphaerales bacterium]